MQLCNLHWSIALATYIYDEVEMHSKSATESHLTVYDTPFADNSNDVMLEENPAYQTTK